MPARKVITIYHILHQEKKCIGLQYQPDKVLSALVKQLPTLAWSEKHHMPCIRNTKVNLDRIYETFKGVAWVNSNRFFKNKKRDADAPTYKSVDELNKEIQIRHCPLAFVEKLVIKGYSKNTAKTYIRMFERFAQSIAVEDLNVVNDQDIRDYLLQEIAAGSSRAFQNQMLNAIKFYYEVVLEMPNRFYHLERPRQEERLPTVLSMEQVRAMIDACENIKHKCMVGLLYSSGMRRSELLKLEIADIDSDRMVIHIRSAKGKKDRLSSLSRTCLSLLRAYYAEWRPEKYLFEGLHGGPYSESSLAKVVKRAAKKAGVRKRVTCHTLRHSFATHLLENGTNLRVIQELLGHSSSRTTEIYTQVAKNRFDELKNPLDDVL
jgi:site-specific recombinase XerD